MLTLSLLLMLALALPPAAAATSVDMPVATSYQVSGVAKAIDNASGEFDTGPGRIDIVKSDHALYVRLGASVSNGTRLTSLNDYESGIMFRNNTMLLPLYAGGERTGALIMATDNLTADGYGYTGPVTGLEVDSGKITAQRDGLNFTAGAVISLTDLPAGASYRVAFADDASLEEAIVADLEVSGMAVAASTPALKVSAGSTAAGDAVSFVIVTIEAGKNWTGPNNDKNITFYRYAGNRLSQLRFSTMTADDGGLVYQAISPGTGQFTIVGAVPRNLTVERTSADGSDTLFLGGLLAVLVAVLVIMVRRVIKR